MARQLPLVIALVSTMATAHAEDSSNFYYGIALGGGEIEIDQSFATASGITDTDASDIKDLSGTLGYELFSFFSVEGHVGVSSDDNGSLLGDAQITRLAGLGRLNYAADKVNAYLLGGIAAVNYDFAGRTTDEVGPAFGAGVDLFGNDTTAISVTFMSFPSDDVDFTVLNVGYRHFFGGAK